LERAKNEDKPWTPEETSELRSLVSELGASMEAWPLIARRLRTGRHPVQVMSYHESLPKRDLFEESEDDEPPVKKTRGKAAAAPPTPDEASSDDDVPISRLRVQKYAVGDRIEADWKSEGEFFPGRIAAAKKDTYSIQYDDGDFERNVSVARIRPLVRIDEGRIRSMVRRVPLEKREAVLREAIKRVEASLPAVDRASSKGDLPIHSGDEFAAIVAKALDEGSDAPSCVRNALGKDSTLLTYFRDGPKSFLRRLRDLGHGSLSLLSFAGGSVSVDAALSLDVHGTPVALTPKLGGRLLDVLNGEATDRKRAPCLKGVPRFATALYGAYDDSEQFLVVQPGPSGDLRPHVDYLGSGVIYVLLQGKKRVSVWRPFPDEDRSNLSILASGHRRDVDVEHELRGPRYDLDMRPGDALFIPPLFPHLVRNYEGGSVAYGVNIISQASSSRMAEVRSLSPYDRAVFACHYLPADYPDEEWAAHYSEESTEKALDAVLQRVSTAKPGLAETLRREATLKGREATVVTPDVARTQPFAATRIGGATSLADMAKVAAAVARAAPPPPEKTRLPPHYAKRRASDDDKKKRSRSRGRRRRKSPSRSSSSSSRSRSRSPKKRRTTRSKSSSRSRSRSPKKRRRRRSRSRSRRKGRRKNRYDTALPSSSRSPPPRQRSRSRSRGRRRRSRSPKPQARYGSRQSRSPPPPAGHYGPAPPPSRYDTALPKRRGHELPARPHRYAHAPGAARTPSRSPPPTKPTLSLAEQAKAAARDASRG
jgi:hypothetical protein